MIWEAFYSLVDLTKEVISRNKFRDIKHGEYREISNRESLGEKKHLILCVNWKSLNKFQSSVHINAGFRRESALQVDCQHLSVVLFYNLINVHS